MTRLEQINPPSVPDFFTYKSDVNKGREGGLVALPKIDISQLSHNEAKEFSEMLKSEFMKNWATRKQKFCELQG